MRRLGLTSIQAISSTATALSLGFSYPTANNGNISTQTNNVDTGRTQNYQMDALNRLVSAQTNATSGIDCWGQSFTLDALANFKGANSLQCSSFAPQYGVDANNHINSPTGYSYDLAGNSTADGLYNYTYDAENRIASASGMAGGPYCYTYDGNNMRVAKSNGTSCSSATVDVLYWRNIAGNTIAETDSTGSTTNANYHEYVFFAGRRVARSDPSSGYQYYYFVDQIGSTRSVAEVTPSNLPADGTVCFSVDYYPYGQDAVDANLSCLQNYKFAGYEQDGETGLYYAFARYYNDRLGRFMSGDPHAGDIGDPQTLNRYSYLRNNPANLIDPTGMDGQDLQDLTNLPTSPPIYVTVTASEEDQPGKPGVGPMGGPPDSTNVGYTNDFENCQTSPLCLCKWRGNCAEVFHECTPQTPEYCKAKNTVTYLVPPAPGTPVPPSKPKPTPAHSPTLSTCQESAVGNYVLHAGVDAIGVIPWVGKTLRATVSLTAGWGLAAMDQNKASLGAAAAETVLFIVDEVAGEIPIANLFTTGAEEYVDASELKQQYKGCTGGG